MRGGGYAAPSAGMRGAEVNHGGFNSANRSNFNSNSGWAGQHPNWYGRNGWNNYYYGNGGWGGRGRWWGGGWGYWPWVVGWGLGWGYPNGYNYYYPDGGYYYYYPDGGYYSSSTPAVDDTGGGVADPGLSAPQQTPAAAAAPAPNDENAASEGLQYYSQARSAFLGG